MGDFIANFTELLDDQVSEEYVPAVKKMYIEYLRELISDHSGHKFAYMFLTNLITIASVLVTALITLERTKLLSDAAIDVIFWTAWGLSLGLTISHKLLYVFNVHKKYVTGIAAVERLQREGWCYICGVDKYTDLSDDDRFRIFVEKVMKIRSSIESVAVESATATPTSGLPNHPLRFSSVRAKKRDDDDVDV